MAAFGTEFSEQLTIAHYVDGAWGPASLQPMGPLPIHPAAHVLHYASTCFEGFKAYRWDDGSVHIFRSDMHIARMRNSAKSLHLPVPDTELLTNMVESVICTSLADIPPPPGALYLRPTLIGTTPNIGAAASPADQATLFVLASPVGDYFKGGAKPLRILVDDTRYRTVEHLGSTKTGANYAAALAPTLAAKQKFDVDQVLFCPEGDVQETGAANFLLIGKDRVVTKPLDTSFLHGVTRDSILTLAGDLGMRVEERDFSVSEMLALAEDHEAALSGTAACLTPIGTFIHQGKEIQLGEGGFPRTARLRDALCDIHAGKAGDLHGWLQRVSCN